MTTRELAERLATAERRRYWRTLFICPLLIPIGAMISLLARLFILGVPRACDWRGNFVYSADRALDGALSDITDPITGWAASLRYMKRRITNRAYGVILT